MNLVPVAKLLIKRGHPLVNFPHHYGFRSHPIGTLCELARPLTEDDWKALTERFAFPENIVFVRGAVRDYANQVEIRGVDEAWSKEGMLPIDVWLERQRRAGDAE